MIVDSINSKKIFNSRREPTIEVEVKTKFGKSVASAPGGKSRGKHEAQPFSCRGIDFSLAFVNRIGKQLALEKISFSVFSDLEKVEKIVRRYDKSKDWNLIGGNALYALEAALLKAIALSEEKELWRFLDPKPKILPMPLGNCIGGGMHVRQTKKADFQEFLILPKTKTFFDAYFINLQAYKEAKKALLIEEKRLNLTDENAFASTLNNEKILSLLNSVKEKIKEKFDISLELGIDAATSHFWDGKHYNYKNFPGNSSLTKDAQIEYISKLVSTYGLKYIEDPLEQEDFNGFSRLLKIFKEKNIKTLLTADDLICTQYELLEKAIKEKSINSVIIKPNQNGSLLDTKRVLDLAKKHDVKTVMSHRSGETFDDTIADLAVGWQCPLIKTGILGRERFAKLNRLLKIERELKSK